MKTLLTEDQEKLVIENLGLTHFIAQRYFHDYLTRDDLASCGAIALMDASRKFDESKGVKFSTFASKVINFQLCKVVRRTKSFQTASLNFVIDEEGCELSEIIPSEVMVEKDVSVGIDVSNAMQQLNETEKFVIENRYGLNGKDSMIQSEIASFLNVSQMSISRIEKRALNKMRKYLEGEN